MKKHSLKKKFRYYFDNTMSRGIFSLVGPLIAASIIFIILMAIIFYLFKIFPGKNIIHLISISLMRTINAESMDETNPNILYVILMVIIAVFSIFFISILIGLLTTTIESKIRNLRKGRSIIIEKNHTVILGWSDMIFTIISELVDACNHTRKLCIAILGNKDKTEMEDLIKERVKLCKNVRVICRQGSPIEIEDLKIVSVVTSKSVIILDKSDSNILKTVLAIINNTGYRKNPFNIVAALEDSNNYEVAKIAGKHHADFILVKDFISKIIAQSALQPGLSVLYTDLMNFAGDEIYFQKCSELTGMTFKETLFACDKSSVIGLNKNGNVVLNPPMETKIEENDEIIVISECEGAFMSASSCKDIVVDKSLINNSYDYPQKGISYLEKILILGWNNKIFGIINELDKYLSEGCEVTIAGDFYSVDNGTEKLLKESVKNIKLNYLQANIKDRNVLNQLTSENYNHIVILASEDKNLQETDAETIMILIHLRDIAEKKKLKFSISSEIIDIRNMELARVAKVNDFIISAQLTSLMMTQLSENKLLNKVFEDFLDEAGSEIYFKQAKYYVKLNEPLNFYTVIESASNKGEVAIGYKIFAEEQIEEKNFGISLNPLKTDKISFMEGDSIIVIAED